MIQSAFNYWIHKNGKFTYGGKYVGQGGFLGLQQLIYEYTNPK